MDVYVIYAYCNFMFISIFTHFFSSSSVRQTKCRLAGTPSEQLAFDETVCTKNIKQIMINVNSLCGSKCYWFSDMPGVVDFGKWFLKHAEELWKDLYIYLPHFDALRDDKERIT